MKEILTKLINGDNSFNIKIFGHERNCKIIQLDLWGLDEGKGRALVKFENPVMKIVQREVENTSFGYETETSTRFIDAEVPTYEEWVYIGY